MFGSPNDFYFYTPSSSVMRHPVLLDQTISNNLNVGETIEYVHIFSQLVLLQTTDDRILYWCYNDDFNTWDATETLQATSTNKISTASRNLVLMENGDLYIIYFDIYGNYNYPAIKQLPIYAMISTQTYQIPYGEDMIDWISYGDDYTFGGYSYHQFGTYEIRSHIISEDEELFVKWIENN